MTALSPIAFTHDIRDFGAIGDGVTLNTSAVQQAIDLCTSTGGGTVVVAGGRYVIGTIYLKDHVTLRIENGAVLAGSTNIDHYTTDTHRNMCKDEPHMDRCLIFAKNAQSIRLEGGGTIDGQGGRENFPNPGDPMHNRPMMIRFVECSQVTITGLTLRDPAGWTCATLYCRDLVFDGLRIRSWVNDNGDGFDLDSCQQMNVSNCTFETSDDSICLQTSRPDLACRDLTVTNCVFYSRWAGIRIGLMSRGNFENIVVSNCVFKDIEDSGLKIQMCEGARMSNMTFSNLVMQNVPRPVFMTFCQQRVCDDSPKEMLPMKAMERIQFDNIVIDSSACDKHSGIFLTGLPGHPIEGISFTNIRLLTGGGGTAEEGAARSIPEYTLETLGNWWPEYYGLNGALPSHGIFARHVRDLTISGVTIQTAQPDARPAIVCDDVSSLRIANTTTHGSTAAESNIRLQNVQEAYLHGNVAQGESPAFLAVEGEHTKDVLILDRALLKGRPVTIHDSVASDAVQAS